MSARYAVLAGLVTAGALLACTRRPRADVERTDAPQFGDSIYVQIINDNYYDSRVYVVFESGTRYPLGTVSGNGRQPAIAIPWLPRALRIELLIIIGGGRYTSDPLDTRPGEFVEVRIPPNVDASGFFHRIR
jgi:hypothetical protein